MRLTTMSHSTPGGEPEPRRSGSPGDKSTPGALASERPGQQWVRIGGFAALAALAALMLRPFLAPAAWAVVLVFATWPLFRLVERALAGRTVWAALCMTLMLVIVVAAPASMASLALAREAQELYIYLARWTPPDIEVPSWVKDLPLVGPQLAEQLEALRAQPNVVDEWLLSQARPWALFLAGAARDIGRNLVNAGLTLFTLFFLYVHGRTLLAQSRRVMVALAGARVEALLLPAGETIRAVMYGVLLTALAQGSLGGLGYWAAGLGAPVLLAVTTGLLAFLPFGAPIVYVPSSIWLLLQGRYLAGALLLAWGVLVVSSVDNLIRSWLISGVARIPFLLVFFGVVGGLTAFGLIGVFIGPVLVTLLLHLWREWALDEGPRP
ncbi:MAG: AI-2E family transporter [Candidatus Methylomirabilia bacterium]